MIVTVDGTITSKELKKKEMDGGAIKTSTELLLAQPGEKTLITIRLEGDQVESYDLFTPETFTGQLLSWKTRDAVGMMVMVGDRF
ncbi:hypothetical protein [Saccharibacillus qingshengii]|uniref:hypothetical protein n=1 Tax=Saccharibacillus qingshengii TaxID=1763540 RepID=UPI0015517626|nr:hypothetical protein [Saccharibacillus qingshengii]